MEKERARICILEDDEDIRELITYTLGSFTYECASYPAAEEMFRDIKDNPPDLFLLDIMLPGMDGLEVLRHLRGAAATKNIPVIIITAKSSEFDKVTGLDAGADDFLAKPFGVLELAARVRAVLRRADRQSADPGLRRYLDITIDQDRYEASRGGEKLDLTLKEYELLRLLCENMGKVVTRETIQTTI